MERLGGSDALRAAAPDWSLAGDRQLLALLHEIHQKIMSRCEDTSNKLEEMVAALDTASVSLQNVNNRFTALSNSQFIESRVYDDDDNDFTVEAAEKKKTPQPPATAPSLVAGLLTLESLHEPVPICEDSDSDTGSDQPTRIILKPKDPYAARPLPYIIGSDNWKAKWHVGLVCEDSEPDSSGPSRSASPAQYSETDSEPGTKPGPLEVRYRQSSSTSSERELTQSAEGNSSQSVQPSQADIAAELARRLGGYVEDTRPPARLDDDEDQTPVQRKVYKPQQPTSATIFSDEPPPLPPARDSDVDGDTESDNDDIFAEINRKAPYSAQNKPQNATNVDIFADLHSTDDDFGRREPDPVKNYSKNRPKADLFGDLEEDDAFVDGNRGQTALVNEIKAKVASNNAESARKADVKQNKPLFEEPEESDLFQKKLDGRRRDESGKANVKKPAGAISLFGNNQGAASIGAAILSRNRRKSSSGESNDDDSNDREESRSAETIGRGNNREDSINREGIQSKAASKNKVLSNTNEAAKTKVNTNGNKAAGAKEKDVIDDGVRQKERDIFDDLFERSAKKNQSTANSNKHDEKKKVDLFSDNIFDDIDDIFSSSVVIKKTTKHDNTKSLFDDDNLLFVEVDRSVKSKNNAVDKLTKNVKKDDTGLFDSDDDLFSNKKSVKSNKEEVKHDSIDKTATNVFKTDAKTKSIFDRDDELFSVKKSASKVAKTEVKLGSDIPGKPKETRGLFDDDDDNNIFSNTKPPILTPENKMAEAEKRDVVTTESVKNNEQNEIEKVSGLLDLKTESKNGGASQMFSVDIETPKTDSKMQTFTDSVKNDTAKEIENIIHVKPTESQQKSFKSPSIFDDEDEQDNLFTKEAEKEQATKEKIVERKFATTEKPDIAEDTKVVIGNLNKKNEVIKKQDVVKSPSIFDSDSDDDIFAKTEKAKSQKDNLDSTCKPINDNNKTKIKEDVKETSTIGIPKYIHAIDNATGNLDTNKNIEEKDTLFTTEEDVEKDNIATSNTKINEPSIFDDIYTEPPVFEKPKEPKRSKNVNALFDDDSDDESLFFKKNDVISDDKIVEFPVASDEKIFPIFHDEPPAIDLDFSVKSNEKPEEMNIAEQNVVKYIEKPTQVDEKPDNKTEKVDVELKLPEKSIKVHEKQLQSKDLDKTDGGSQSKTEPIKPIGKLKPMQFNINVNTLLPGASPKKVVRITPESEPQLKQESMNQELNSKSITGPTTSKTVSDQGISKLVKSASFEETPESPVLDNKLSKDRAKIQVKRRPSTRRARKEAARKSAIDFVDGPDDGSQGSDGNNKNIEAEKKSDDYNDNAVVKDVSINNATEKEEHGKDHSVEIEGSDTSEKKEVRPNVGIDFMDKTQQLSAEKVLSTVDNVSIDARINVIEKHKHIEATNDFEDLFKQKVMDIAEKVTSKVEKQQISSEISEKTQVLNINDTDVYIFKDTQVKEQKNVTKDADYKSNEVSTKIVLDEDTSVQTIGRIYKRTDEQKKVSSDSNPTDVQDTFTSKQNSIQSETKHMALKKTSLFNDLSDDDDLFSNNTKTEKSKQKNVFSDTEDDVSLFAATASIRKDALKSVGGEKSLFGDEDDDDEDLFGVKRKTSREELQPANNRPAPKTSATTAATVFDDPLSMFGTEDDA